MTGDLPAHKSGERASANLGEAAKSEIDFLL